MARVTFAWLSRPSSSQNFTSESALRRPINIVFALNARKTANM